MPLETAAAAALKLKSDAAVDKNGGKVFEIRDGFVEDEEIEEERE